MTFKKNQRIVDSFVIANEVTHSWRKDKEDGLLIKLDFEKAYDSVDHSFLDSVLMEMGFRDRWRGWMRDCITTPTLSILVNGSPTDQFGVERGLRQGDMLSPILFNIAIEALNCLFKKASNVDLLRGVILGHNELHVTHLQFANDTILFVKPKLEYLLNVKWILRCFKLASGLCINFHKSCIVKVGKKGLSEGAWDEIFRCKKANLAITYLGLSLGANPCTKKFWDPMLQKI
ncbi:hypothetical protein Dsin_007578 [Dipteronia sinensis]|uniref:Reverse transcriptase domain-containing protein n=1 Tax=Dipteronia sinensis TaxID=43782 RepID=A0AAE0B0T8_9ROSI|nr:hypothetical protein Dsin_007578 [Dipteronia sinensis]